MKLYKLYLAKPLLIFYLLILTAWMFAGIIGIVVGAAGKFAPEGPPAWSFLVLLVVAVFTAYMWLRIPFEIKMRDDGLIEFRSVLRRTTISPMEIKSVRAKLYALGFVDVVHRTGTVHLLSQMDGFHDFISTVKSLNPELRIVGC
jgi:membrane protein implicated in regulation of membrane protease activity